MTELGHLLGSVEDGVAAAHRDEEPSHGLLERTRSEVRRRRTRRHLRDGLLGSLVVVLVAGGTAWAAQERPVPPAEPSPAPSAAATATDPTPQPAPSPDPADDPASVTVQLAAPRDVRVDALLAQAGPGWSLATTSQVRLGVPADSFTGEDMRSTVDLVSPTGDRTTLLDVESTALLGVLDWRPGDPTALAYGSPDVREGFLSGVLDLRTGTLRTAPLGPEREALGLTVDGGSAWLLREAAPEPDLTAGAGGYSSAVPGSGVAIEPESMAYQLDDMPAAVPYTTGRLVVVDADGTTRDLGAATLPHRLHPLSPDRRWLALRAPDGGLLGVDLRTGEQHPVPGAPTDPACRLAGWADDHAVLAACPGEEGTWRLDAVDLADGRATRLATSDVPVRDAWPLGDGRVGLGRVVVPSPCDVTSDPAVLAGGAVRSLTGGWSRYDHGTSLTFAGGAVWTHLNGCYPGNGRADPQRDVRVDLATGEIRTLAWLDPSRPDGEQVVDDGAWVVQSVDVVPGR